MKRVVAKKDYFEKFLLENQDSSGKIDYEGRKEEWIKSVDKLFKSVSGWLSPFVEKSLLCVNSTSMEIYEMHFGRYDIKRLDILLGKNIVSLCPKGTFIIGGYGRVDLKGPRGEIMLVESKWNKWEVAFRTPEDTAWPLHKESFQHVFKMVVDGEEDNFF